MSFSFMVTGDAGSGMESNSADEIAAVQDLITNFLDDAVASKLEVTITNVSPPQWAPDQLATGPV
jgi:hypothetical protein